MTEAVTVQSTAQSTAQSTIQPALRLVRSRPEALSDRERDVLRLVAEGLSTREVARTLCYSERTIKHVLQDIGLRLHLRNRTHAVAHAIRCGWI